MNVERHAEEEVSAQSPEDDAAEEAAFEATFSQEEKVEEPAEEPVEEPAKEPEPDEPEPPKALTVGDLRALIEEQAERSKQSHAKLAGKVGELQQKIDAARQSTSGISPKARERLATDFPELAEMLFDKDAPPPEPYVPAPPAEDLEKKFELRLLKKEHKDWEQVVASTDFLGWKTSILDKNEAAVLDDSWDADFVSAKITQFKEWKAARETKVQKATQDKQSRLDAAITPHGIPRVGTSSISDDDEESSMVKAFKVRR